MKYTIQMQKMIDEYDLVLRNKEVNVKEKKVKRADVNRLSIQLTGFLDYFDADRIQLIGKVETAYIESHDAEMMNKSICNIFAKGIPCLIYCRDLEPTEGVLRCATKYDIPVFVTDMLTSELASDLARWLRVQLAQRVTIHGVFVDIYGEGVLILGESGIGKSETALELIKRGHRFVADDAVEIKKVSNETLIGASPEVIRHLIELRGIGVIDIHQLFGVESIMMTQSVDLIIKLTDWDAKANYERLGLVEEYYEVMGIKVVCHTIPIRPGSNLAVICEAAAINHRQKKMGYNAAEELESRLSTGMSKTRKPPKITALPKAGAKKVGTIQSNQHDYQKRSNPFE